jgi:outer membrane lipoprotein-sorting protein
MAASAPAGKTPPDGSPKAQTPVASTQAPAAGTGETKPPATLNSVLDAMDRQARMFSSARTDLLWDQYEASVQVHDLQSGTMWIRKKGKNLEMTANLWQGEKPGSKGAAEKYLLLSGGRVQVFQPKVNQVLEYDTGKDRQAFESFLVLGFGGGGHALLDQFSVRYVGQETLKGVGTEPESHQGVSTEKLELIPKSSKVKGMFERIELWINPAGVSVQQKFYETANGNFRLVRYSNIGLNVKVKDDVFKLKTNSSTQTVDR